MLHSTRKLIISTHRPPLKPSSRPNHTATPRQSERLQGRHRRPDLVAPTTPQHGFHCEAATYTPSTRHSLSLGTSSAATPRLALRWLLHRASQIADQLDAPAAAPVRHWINDQAEHEHALSLLVRNETYTFTIFDDTTRYALSACPMGDAR